MKTVALQQVSSEFARKNAGRTLDKSIAIRFIERYLQPSLKDELNTACPDGNVFIWGAKLERSHQTYKMLGKNSLFLFRQGRSIYQYGVLIEKTINEELAEKLWGLDEDGESWANVFFFSRITNTSASASKINAALKRSDKYNWQGLVVLTLPETEMLDDFFKAQLKASGMI